MNLNELKPGQSGVIETVGGEGALRQHFLDMGVIPGTEVSVIKLAPLGDPMELQIHGYELTLRLADAEKIGIVPVSRQEGKEEKQAQRSPEHPGLGEEGRFHPKGSGDPLPDGTKLTFALVGNQNSGKTTLFNQLTGSNQHVGNFPGVTVDRKDGVIRGHSDTLVTDLPGIYSMSPYSSEELVSRDFVLRGHPKAIINIVDATNIERNLYLTMQLLEMNIPMVVALNMMDELRGNGGTVDVNAMEAMLGVPVVPISAAKNEGVDELIRHAIHVAKYQEKPLIQDFCGPEDHNGAVHRALHAVEHLIEDHAVRAELPVRFTSSKLIVGDPLLADQLELDQNERETLDHLVLQMEKERGMDRSASVADMRFAFIRKVCDASVIKPKESRERVRSEKIDRVLTGKHTAIPLFILIMALVFFLTFFLIGPFFQDLLQSGIDALRNATEQGMEAVHINETIQSLVLNGIFEGVGTVVSFLPIIVILFFFLSLLEDSGYIARVAFVMDKLLRRIGLSGRSIVPMLIGFGCTVPAVMSTRTLPSERDRRMTILLTPFMSCTAKMPIYGFFVTAFFPQYGWLIITGLYLLGILTGIAVAFLFKNTLFKGEAVPFVMAGRLAYCYFADQRLHGQGKRGLHNGNPLRRRTGSPRLPDRGFHAGLQPAVYPLCGRGGRHPARARPEVGAGRGALAVCHCLGRRPDHPAHRNDFLRRFSHEHLGYPDPAGYRRHCRFCLLPRTETEGGRKKQLLRFLRQLLPVQPICLSKENRAFIMNC